MVYSNTAVHGGKMSMVNPVTCLFSLPDAFEVQIFQGFIFTPYQRYWEQVGPCISDVLKVETLLKNDFKKKSFQGMVEINSLFTIGMLASCTLHKI